MVAKIAEKLGGALVPPGIDPTTWWRLAVSATIFGVLLWISWAMGAFAAFGTPGLARADQQKEILDELHAQKVERLEEAIMKAQRDYCAQPQNTRPREFYLSQRNMKLNEYRETTGRSYEGLPDCEQL